MRSRSGSDWHLFNRRPRRSALRRVLSITQVLAAAAAAFFLLPLIVHAAPAEPVTIVPGGSTDPVSTLRCGFNGQETLPSGTVYCLIRLGSPPQSNVDTSMFLYVPPSSIKVLDRNDVEVSAADPDPLVRAHREAFINFWRISALTRPIFTRSAPTEHDLAYDPRYPATATPEALPQSCAESPMSGYDGAAGDTARMCSLGVLRGIAGPNAFTDSLEPAYERQYAIAMHELDTGTDQSFSIGWGLQFDMVFRSDFLTDDTCPATHVNGICTTLVYERS